MVGKGFDVLPPFGSDAASGIVSGVVGDLGEDCFVFGDRVAPMGQERVAADGGGSWEANPFQPRGVEVELGHHALVDAVFGDCGAGHDEGDTDAGIVQRGLGAGEGDAVVGGEDKDSVVGEARLLESCFEDANGLIDVGDGFA